MDVDEPTHEQTATTGLETHANPIQPTTTRPGRIPGIHPMMARSAFSDEYVRRDMARTAEERERERQEAQQRIANAIAATLGQSRVTRVPPAPQAWNPSEVQHGQGSNPSPSASNDADSGRTIQRPTPDENLDPSETRIEPHTIDAQQRARQEEMERREQMRARAMEEARAVLLARQHARVSDDTENME